MPEFAEAEVAVQRHTQELAALHAIAATVSRSLDLDRILDDALDEVLKLDVFEAEARAKVFLLDAQMGTLSLAAQRRVSPEHPCLQQPIETGECLCGLAAEQGQVIVSANAWEDERHTRRWPDMLPHKDVCVPLKAKGKVLGVLDVWLPAGWGVADTEIALLTAISDQIGIAIENARLFEEARKRAETLAVISDIERAMLSTLSLAEIAEAVTTGIGRLIPYERASIALLEEDRDAMAVLTAVGQGEDTLPRGLRIPLSGTAISAVMDSGQTLYRPDIAAAERLYAVDEQLLAEGIRSDLIIPLIARGKTFGTLNFGSERTAGFTEEHIRLAEDMAREAAIAVENARLYASEQRQRQRAEILREVAGTLGSTLDIEQVLQLLLEQLARLVAYDSACVMLLTDDELRIVADRGFRDPERERRVVLGQDDPKVQEMLRRQGPLIIADVRTDPRWRKMEATEYIHSWIGAPLLVGDRLIGLLNIDKAEPGYYTSDEAGIVQAFAYQAAMAIENARLYEQVEERARELNGKLVAQKQYAETVLRSIADGVYSTDLERRVLSWSRGAEEITGFRAEEVIGRYCQDFLRHTDDQGRALCDVACPLTECFRQGQPVGTKDVWVHTAQGRKVPVSVSAAPIHDTEGTVVGAVEVFRDVSKERKLMESIRQANEARSRFLANMSHELRTPLHSVIGFAELLRDRVAGPLTERQEEYVDFIHSGGTHLLDLINDVLDLSRVDAGKMELRTEPLSPERELEHALTLVSTTAARRELTMELNLADDLPATIQADPRIFKQIMFNLLSNALKFTPAGGRVEVRGRGVVVHDGQPTPPLPPGEPLADGRWVLVGVADTGIGIAPTDLERVFDEFERLGDTYTRQQEGTGLGLALTRRLVKLHGGHIWAESAGPGQGSTFSFVLPIGDREGKVSSSKRRSDPLPSPSDGQAQDLPRDPVLCRSGDRRGQI